MILVLVMMVALPSFIMVLMMMMNITMVMEKMVMGRMEPGKVLVVELILPVLPPPYVLPTHEVQAVEFMLPVFGTKVLHAE